MSLNQVHHTDDDRPPARATHRSFDHSLNSLSRYLVLCAICPACNWVSEWLVVCAECGLLIFVALRRRMENPLVIPSPSCWIV